MMEYFSAWAIVTDGLAMLATLAVLVVAVVVAIVMTRKKQCIAASWLLVIGRAGVWFGILGFLVLDIAASMMAVEIRMVITLLIRLLFLLFMALTAVAFLLFKPPAKTTTGGPEVSHG